MLPYILSILLLLFLIYLLFVPIVLFIDTETDQYFVQIKGLLKASITSHKTEVLIIRLKILFLQFRFYPLQRKQSSPKRKKKSKTKRYNMRQTTRKGWRLLKSFKIKHFYINIDTGDYVQNAKLYPLFVLLNYKVGSFYINFEGKNQLKLKLENRPIYIVKSIINI